MKFNPLQPEGIGTGSVESLTSYISRLAHFHWLATWVLVVYELAPCFQRRSIADGRGQCDLFAGLGASLNGCGKTATEAVSILQGLTGQKDLQSLTLQPIGNVISLRESLRPWGAWCPVCLTECYEQNGRLFYPLIWHLKTVKICPIHTDTCLQEVCPSCGERHRPLHRHLSPGICPRCGQWLGIMKEYRNPALLSPHDTRLSIEAYAFLQKVAAFQCTPSLRTLKRNLHLFRKIQFGGSNLKFSQALGLHHSSLSDLVDGNARPSLETLFRIAITTDTPAALMVGTLVAPTKSILCHPSFLRRNLRHYDWQLICDELHKLSANEILPESLHRLCLRLHVDENYVRKRLRSVTNVLIQQFKSQRSERHKAREQSEERDIEDRIFDLVRHGFWPSHRRMKKVLKSPGSLRNPKLQELRRNLVVLAR